MTLENPARSGLWEHRVLTVVQGLSVPWVCRERPVPQGLQVLQGALDNLVLRVHRVLRDQQGLQDPRDS